MNIYQKLAAIQCELIAPKSRTNNFGNYRYRKAEDILEALKPLLKKYDCLVLLLDELLDMEGDRYIRSTCRFVDTQKPDEGISTFGLAKEASSKKGMDPAQVTGSTSSYARKYALNGMFAIDDAKDLDQQKPALESRIISGERFAKMKEAIMAGKYSLNQATEQFDLTEKQQNELSNL